MVDYTAHAAEMIKQFDTNGDGELGIEEFEGLYNAFKEKRPDLSQFTV